jgi:hypothetical protein
MAHQLQGLVSQLGVPARRGLSVGSRDLPPMRGMHPKVPRLWSVRVAWCAGARRWELNRGAGRTGRGEAARLRSAEIRQCLPSATVDGNLVDPVLAGGAASHRRNG